MLILDDLFDVNDYAVMVVGKFIKEQTHPNFPDLRIVNYTESATWEKMWNYVTLNCRGIIYHAETFEIIARPFRKFFNYGQEGAPTFSLDDSMQVTEKMDGSLGILYKQPDGQWAIATRGSFASDQAIWATKFYQENIAPIWEPNPHWTYLFEIIYPQNRIVVDYGKREDLVMLGAIEIETGRTVHFDEATHDYPNGITGLIAHDISLAEVLAIEPRSNAEGFVLHNIATDERIKIKFEEYVTLHRFMTRTTPKHIWEILSTNGNPDEIFAQAPDEFHEWLKEVIADLQTQYREIYQTAVKTFQLLPNFESRKDFALAVQSLPNRALLFKQLDGRDLAEDIWKQIKPSGDALHGLRVVNSDAD